VHPLHFPQFFRCGVLHLNQVLVNGVEGCVCVPQQCSECSNKWLGVWVGERMGSGWGEDWGSYSSSICPLPAPLADTLRRMAMAATWRVADALLRCWRPLDPALVSFSVLNTKPGASGSRPRLPLPDVTWVTCLGGRGRGWKTDQSSNCTVKGALTWGWFQADRAGGEVGGL
jgi:hypothetical protein